MECINSHYSVAFRAICPSWSTAPQVNIRYIYICIYIYIYIFIYIHIYIYTHIYIYNSRSAGLRLLCFLHRPTRHEWPVVCPDGRPTPHRAIPPGVPHPRQCAVLYIRVRGAFAPASPPMHTILPLLYVLFSFSRAVLSCLPETET